MTEVVYTKVKERKAPNNASKLNTLTCARKIALFGSLPTKYDAPATREYWPRKRKNILPRFGDGHLRREDAAFTGVQRSNSFRQRKMTNK